MDLNDKRARDEDRDQAIEVVEAAWADGQIVEADRDKRVENLLLAQTMAEVQMLTHDLHRPQSQLPPVEYATGQAATPVVDVALPQLPQRARRVNRIGCLLVPVVFVLIFAGVAVMIALGLRSDQELDPGAEPGVGQVNVLSTAGMADLVQALREETGASKVFGATLYPTYAVIDVPVDATTQREQSFYWDGDLSEWAGKGTASESRFDLAQIDADVVVDLVGKARRKVDDPDTWYVIIARPEPEGDGTWIRGYATNEYSESGYLGSDRDGTITWEPDLG